VRSDKQVIADFFQFGQFFNADRNSADILIAFPNFGQFFDRWIVKKFRSIII